MHGGQERVLPADVTEAHRAQALDESYDVDGVEILEQIPAGADVPSDREYGKSMWTGYVGQHLGGTELRPLDDPAISSPQAANSKDRFDFYEIYNREAGSTWIPKEVRQRHPGITWTTLAPIACTGPITYIGQEIIQRDIANLDAALADIDVEEAFLPLAAPASVEATTPNRFYATDAEFLEALAGALHEEYQAVVDAGYLLQVDDAFIPFNWDIQLARGATMDEYLAHCSLRIDAVNEALRGIPEDRVRYHICWGSWAGPHTTDVPLKDIVDLVLRVNAQAYSVEAANPRHEFEWEVWKDVKLPDGKILIPGVVTHSTNVVEHPRTVAQRLVRYAELVGRENVMGGTDCGFSQGWSMPRTHPSVQWAKLRALSEGAEIATAELWR